MRLFTHFTTKFLTILIAIFTIIGCGDVSEENNPQPASSTDQPEESIDEVVNEGPEVWMTHGNPWILGTSQEWSFVQTNLDVLKIYIDNIADADINELRNLVETLQEHEIKIAIELGGLVDWHADKQSQSAQFSFNNEFSKIKLLIDPVSQGGAGGTIDYLDMDGPIRRMLYPFNEEQDFHDFESANQQLFEMMDLWQQALPEVKVFVLTNFPNWGWKGDNAYFNIGFAPGSLGYGDYHEVVNMILDQNDQTPSVLAGITIDNPYDYTTGEAESNQPEAIQGIDWLNRIRELEELVESREMEVNLIYNHAASGDFTRGSPKDYSNETLTYIDVYEQVGGSPNGYMIQSWYFHPEAWVPETTPYTMTNLTMEAINKIKG